MLELGCGCGAITRYLSEKRCQVDAVEGSAIRSQIAATRASGYSNTRVFHSNFSSLSFEKEYDIVTLIGVLEYAPHFFEDDNPVKACLKVAANALKDDGMLVIAIENQLGIK